MFRIERDFRPQEKTVLVKVTNTGPQAPYTTRERAEAAREIVVDELTKEGWTVLTQ